MIYEALQSLSSVYKQKNLTAEELRRTMILNLSGSPNLMLQPPFTDTVFFFNWIASLFQHANFCLNSTNRLIAIFYHSIRLKDGSYVSALFKFLVELVFLNFCNLKVASPLCMGYMHHQECLEMFKNVLLNGHVHTLYRDDTILTHDFLLKFLDLSKK